MIPEWMLLAGMTEAERKAYLELKEEIACMETQYKRPQDHKKRSKR